ncbi:hypothetical protein ACFZBU_41380 [Embleya sp. NPDC008237]|uniref:hypothetical protein n=1 Tax=Embleya sp. NPDC008237 TaxID=3363978 RepID=UPI0036ED07FB
MEFATEVLVDHPAGVEECGVPDPTPTECWTGAAEDLVDREEIVVRLDRAGRRRAALHEECRGQGADRLRESHLHITGRADGPEATTELLLRPCREQIAACDRAVEPETEHRRH